MDPADKPRDDALGRITGVLEWERYRYGFFKEVGKVVIKEVMKEAAKIAVEEATKDIYNKVLDYYPQQQAIPEESLPAKISTESEIATTPTPKLWSSVSAQVSLVT